MSIPYTKTPTAITVVVNFTPKVIPSSHPNFTQIVELVQNPKTTEAQLIKLLDLPKAISDFSGGKITTRDGRLFFGGMEVQGSVVTFILSLIKEGKKEAAKPFENFLAKAFENPDRRAVTDLYDWIINSKLPITEDGDILAWKAVRDDYFSIHGYNSSNPQFDHHIGSTVEEDRSRCDPNPDKTCSRGLHFCSADYLKNYSSGGSRIVAVKINPRDVVAFPRDYGWSKGRASKYVVVGEVPYYKVRGFYPQGKPIYSGWTAPAAPAKPAPKKSAGFVMGQVWKDRSGREATIVRTNAPGEYPIQTNVGFYTAKGRYVSDSQTNDRDLFKLVG